jgi:ABC-type nitrate/sulfonate/bicarbonate transport system substrate-binding protein
LSEGYHAVLDVGRFYLDHGGWPPGKVIVATRQTIEQRGQELRAFLRANVRAFWFIQDPQNHAYMYDLDTRLRQSTFNEDERALRMYQSENRARQREGQLGPRAMGYMVMDGLVSRPALADVIDGMVQAGDLREPVAIDSVLKDQPAIDAFQQLLDNGRIDRHAVETWRSVAE